MSITATHIAAAIKAATGLVERPALLPRVTVGYGRESVSFSEFLAENDEVEGVSPELRVAVAEAARVAAAKEVTKKAEKVAAKAAAAPVAKETKVSRFGPVVPVLYTKSDGNLSKVARPARWDRKEKVVVVKISGSSTKRFAPTEVLSAACAEFLNASPSSEVEALVAEFD